MTKRKREQRNRQLRRMAAKWLLGLTNDFDWGWKDWDELEQKEVPKHRNFKETLFNFLSGFRFAYPKRLTQKALIRHFLGAETVYFTGSRGEQTLLMVDIDCHKSGSLEGARQFAEYLQPNFFPNLYYETQHPRQRHPRLPRRGHLELGCCRLQQRPEGGREVAEKSPRLHGLRRGDGGVEGSLPLGDLG